ncbi:MAG: aminopeptidase P family protein [Clostridiales bacterium]|jgi:Xaa-Pro aminopeptidase|nr:aminopeptidase P family protein [Clostridiales bacterium]
MRNAEFLFNGGDLDAAVILGGVNKLYFTDFVSENSCLLIFKDKSFFLLDKRYTEAAAEQFGACKNIGIIDITSGNFFAVAGELLNERRAEKVGFENRTVSYENYESLETLCGALIPISARIEASRCVKDGEELSRMAYAAKIAGDAYTSVLKLLKEGITEKDVADELIYFMRRAGASGVSFDPIVAFDANTSRPHHLYGAQKLKNNSVVTVDLGAVYKGYCSDMTRSFVFGRRAPQKYSEIYAAVLKAQTEALSFLKVGADTRDADGVARAVIEKSGYGRFFTHSLGHSVGLEIHEEPRLSAKGGVALNHGNVVTVEPGIYIEGLFGVRIEDMVAVTDGGIVNFCDTPKELLYI